MAAEIMQDNGSRSSSKSLSKSSHHSRRDRVSVPSNGESKNSSARSGMSVSSVVKTEDLIRDYPLIFKCVECDALFGDSLSWIREDQVMKTITLSRAERKVRVSDKFFYSTEGPDMGCCYVMLQCANCNVDIGRMYRATTRPMDDLRDVYTFDVNRIDNYEIGGNSSCTMNSGSRDDDSGLGSGFERRSLSSHTSEMNKVQTQMTSLGERLQRIESAVGRSSLQSACRDTSDLNGSQSSHENYALDQNDMMGSACKRGKRA